MFWFMFWVALIPMITVTLTGRFLAGLFMVPVGFGIWVILWLSHAFAYGV